MQGGKSGPLKGDSPRPAGGGDRGLHLSRPAAYGDNNWRLQGHDYFRVMTATGHKTMSVFKRYNSVSREELKALVGKN